MTSTQLHLLVSHLPVFGSLLGGLVLAHGMGTKSIQTYIAGYYILLLTSIGSLAAYFSGNMSQEIVKNISDISPILIANHKTFAFLTLVALVILGIVASVALFFVYFKGSISNISNTFSLLTLFVATISFVLVARTSYLGVKIEHQEINNISGLTFPNLLISKSNKES